jgi:hypothetical protein
VGVENKSCCDVKVGGGLGCPTADAQGPVVQDEMNKAARCILYIVRYEEPCGS